VKVLLLHNGYQQPGGEDAVVADEWQLLQQHGHEVRSYQRHNDEISRRPRWRTAVDTVWSRGSHQQVRQIVDEWRPDVVHVHNTLALLSPSVLWAAAGRGAGIVATLHNFRLGCLAANFQRDDAPCELCLGRPPIAGVLKACYRGSRGASAVLAASLVTHRALGTWQRHVHRFIVLAQAHVERFVALGVPRERIRVKPNFAWPPSSTEEGQLRQGGLYVGRLTREKGAHVLAEAARRLPGLVLSAIGEGPEAAALAASGVACLGPKTPAQVQDHMQRAAFLVLPSTGQEQFPRVLAEAYAAGLPVIASALDSLAELVLPGATGLHVRPGDADDLARALAWTQANPAEVAAMGLRARQQYAERYGPEAAYAALMRIYEEVQEPRHEAQLR
jgi:glycosyltransferase involved in cell wall biosynthesis